MYLAIGLEFARGQNVDFEQAAQLAVDAGYRSIEPYVYTPASLPLNSHLTWESRSAYHHLNAAEVDRVRVRDMMERLALEFSAFDAHSTLLMPAIGVPYVKSTIDLASELGSPIVMSDEGPFPKEWIDLDRAFDVMCLSIEQIVGYAQIRKIRFAIELHNALTTHPKYLNQLLRRFEPDALGVNFDTGNTFLAGNDPAEMLRTIADRVIHVHIKDIPEKDLPMRGKVTGTRVGVAAGDGVVDIRSIVEILGGVGYKGALSVECDTWEQAIRSWQYVNKLLDDVQKARESQERSRPSGRFVAALGKRKDSKAPGP